MLRARAERRAVAAGGGASLQGRTCARRGAWARCVSSMRARKNNRCLSAAAACSRRRWLRRRAVGMGSEPRRGESREANGEARAARRSGASATCLRPSRVSACDIASDSRATAAPNLHRRRFVARSQANFLGETVARSSRCVRVHRRLCSTPTTAINTEPDQRSNHQHSPLSTSSRVASFNDQPDHCKTEQMGSAASTVQVNTAEVCNDSAGWLENRYPSHRARGGGGDAAGAMWRERWSE